jgi:cytochrome oxidase Cu insertion factor (SCO1/SenC/PrrC family)
MKSLQCSAWWLVLALGFASCGLAAEPAGGVPEGQGASAADPDAKDRAYFTDLDLVTQDGKSLRFFTDVLKDQVVLISFLFTNCGNACPLQTRALVEVAGLLGDEVGKSLRFVSISIDPERDTPAAMKAFAQKHGADRAGWLFLTGDPANVNAVVKKLGQYSPDVEAHSTLLLAGNVKEKHWVKIPPNLPPQGIAQRLRELIGTGLTSVGG